MSTAAMTPPASKPANYDAEAIRADFPILSKEFGGKPLIYLDNGATTHKPNQVIDTIANFYRYENGTVHRGVYALSVGSTEKFNAAREKVAAFINAASSREIVFTRGSTDAINLVAHSFGKAFVGNNDNIIISGTEHHANIVPWQQCCELYGAELRVIPVLDSGDLDLEAYENLLDENTKLVAVGHVSNALGTIHPVKQIAALAHKVGASVLVDGAQGAPHMPVDVQDLDADFYVFSGHKLYGPTGVGILYGKYDLMKALPPYQTGGDMINSVTFEKTTFADPPRRFEAGTPMIAQVIGLGAAIDYVNAIGMETVHAYENYLLDYATTQLQQIPKLHILGQAKEKTSLISMVIDGVHPHDIGTLLDERGIAVRAGHHCAQPVMKRFGVPATTRASFGIYNVPAEIDALVIGLESIQKLFA